MALETLGEHALTAMNVIAKFFEAPGKVADEAVNIKDAMAGTKLAETMAQTKAIKNVRIATVLLAMIPNIVDVGGPPKPDTLQKGAQVIETLIFGAQRQRGQELQRIQSAPGQETHEDLLQKVSVTVQQMRAKEEYTSDPVKRAALELVLSNILEPHTSSAFKQMIASPTGPSEHDVEAWMQGLGIMSDFKELYDSPMMSDPATREALVDSIHEMYAQKDIGSLQALVGDSRLLFNYEVIFHAMNQADYAREHPERVKDAAETLLEEGNLEDVVAILLRSNAQIFAEKMVAFLAPYVPESSYIQSQAVSLEEDPGYRKLNS